MSGPRANHLDASVQARDMRYAHYINCSGKIYDSDTGDEELNCSVNNSSICYSPKRFYEDILAFFFLLLTSPNPHTNNRKV